MNSDSKRMGEFDSVFIFSEYWKFGSLDVLSLSQSMGDFQPDLLTPSEGWLPPTYLPGIIPAGLLSLLPPTPSLLPGGQHLQTNYPELSPRPPFIGLNQQVPVGLPGATATMPSLPIGMTGIRKANKPIPFGNHI